jgi:SAM-dependent methyltransferase
MLSSASTTKRLNGEGNSTDASLSLRLRERFGVQLVPNPPLRVPATNRLFARLNDVDIEHLHLVLRDQLEPDVYRNLVEVLPQSDLKHYKREMLRYGTHYVPELVAAKTGLCDANPPTTVHSMMRNDIFVGDQYSSDLFVEELEARRTLIVPGGRYLDLGCCSGGTVRYLQAAYPEAHWFGCDPHLLSIDWARENLHGVEFAVRPQAPPLPYYEASFDGAYAISIWCHFSERAALAWFDEMARIIRPGGVLMFTTHGIVTLDFALRNHWRTRDGILEIADDLCAGRYRFEDPYADNTAVESALDPVLDSGDSFTPLSWVATRLLDLWDLLSFQPGRNQENQDLYLLRRKPVAVIRPT